MTNKRFKDYNIVSNKYLEHHDQKVLADEQISKAEAASKYWKTHNFDPVRCTYYNEQKEQEFGNERDAAALVHGKD